MCIKKIKQRFYSRKNANKSSENHKNNLKIAINSPEFDADWQRLSEFTKKTFSHLPETPIEENIEEN